MHINDKTFTASWNADMVQLLRTAQHYLTNRYGRKEDFATRAFYTADAQYESALEALFSEVSRNNQSLFAASWFEDLLDFHGSLLEVRISKIKNLISVRAGCVCFTGTKAST